MNPSAFLLLLMVQAKPDTISELAYSTPPGTDPKTVEKAASQMKRRIEDYGYKGVSTKTDGESVKVTFEPGFTPVMIQSIDRVAKIKGQAYFWGVLPMTQKEFEQWIPGKSSPPGTSWLIDGDIQTIMDNSWKLPMEMRFERFVEMGTESVRLSFSKENSKRFLDRLAKEKVARGFKIMMDEKRFPFAGTIKERSAFDQKKGAMVQLGIVDWIPNVELTDDFLGAMISIGSPLPVELTKKK
jgi:hypothetical protein